ncbi:MAG: hypothetical protein QM487_11115 [Candidatus Marithrix sp.]
MSKNKLLTAALLATASTVKAADNFSKTPSNDGQGVTEGGKSQRGVNHLTLEEAPLDNITMCVGKDGMLGGFVLDKNFRYFPTDKVAIVINPFEDNFVKMTFIVSHVLASDKERVLFLAYSTKTSPSPQILTPISINKLALDLADIEIVGIYNVPAFGMEVQQSTRIGVGNPAARVKWEFDINLDTAVIPSMMNNVQDTIYMQAGLLKKSDFEEGNFSGMILSEVDTIRFVANECPDLIDRRQVTEFEF